MRVLAATATVAHTSMTSIWREYGRTYRRSRHSDLYGATRCPRGTPLMS